MTRPARRSKPLLFLALLTLAVLTQVLFLDWGPEVVFFVTWLLVALTVQHDSRLSAAIGLAFLATCPFLLIAGKDPVAEQAANYAYFFLAIGVLVQFEELLLERYGGLDRKLDLSYLWRPAARALRSRWSTAVTALGQAILRADRSELTRLVQVVGALGLTVVFLVALLTGAHLSLLLPLLGGAILFPFLVWGVRLAIRASGPAWLLRAIVALLILPLAAAEMVWLYDLVRADRIARMESVYSFIEYRDLAQRATPTPEGETIEARMWTIDGETRRVLYHHPAFAGASRIAYPVYIQRRSVLAFDLAMAPECWDLPGDGVTFSIYLTAGSTTEQLFSTYIDPKHDEADRRWHPHTIDLGAYAGQTVTLTFETATGPAGDEQYDWAGWGRPRLLVP